MAKSKAIKTWSTAPRAEEKQPVPCILCGGTSFKAALACEGFSYVKCRSCCLVQMNPQPLEEEVRRRYQGDYLSYEIQNEAPFLRLQLLALADIGFDDLEEELVSSRRPAKARALDIGSAIGSLLVHLQNRGWEASGVEISGPQAKYARRERNLVVYDQALGELHLPPESFELVHASHLIEHLNEPRALLSEAHRILSPQGRLLITTPNIGGLQARLFGGSWRSAIFDHLYLFSKKTLARMLIEEGFTIEMIRTWGGLAAGTAPGPIKSLADRAAKVLGFGDVMIVRAKKSGAS
ncbi:MAG: class I SAM-dependent methyltransferase [Treponema sp.]|nr:class I SAM-dependent methyltransferase [Treponema sp.]